MLARYVYDCAREQGGKKSGKQDESSGMHCGPDNMWASMGPDNSLEHFCQAQPELQAPAFHTSTLMPGTNQVCSVVIG